MKVILPCHCGHKFEYEYADEVEITPEVYSDIVNGNFMIVNCEKCGITLKPEYPVMFTYPLQEKPIKIFLVPEIHRNPFLAGKSQYLYKTTDRFVIGFMELVEKIEIFKAGFDDIVIEGIKYYILSKIENENDLQNEIFIFFNGIENDKMVFRIHGLREGEVGILNVDINFYDMTSEKIKESINEEPFKSFLIPPYISILKIYREYTDNLSDEGQPIDNPSKE
ncbi:MAG: CpXC domain-containing protein [Spirochaetaceae bacterium]|nr:CpXC domain-containing protein [Spirochaetaceae bacterium]